jgi:hypothetical protein
MQRRGYVCASPLSVQANESAKKAAKREAAAKKVYWTLAVVLNVSASKR